MNIRHTDNPYIIAEVGSNFNQDLDTAFRLIDAASEAGANAVKFQLFQADVLYPNGGDMYEIFKSIELSREWVPLLKEHAEKRNLQFLSSAFDRSSIDLLEAVSVPAYKVASSETTDLGFLHYIASKGRPLIISTGMCDMVDVEEAVSVCEAAGNDQIVLLQCNTVYPLNIEDANIRVIEEFAKRFPYPVGFSDHTLSSTAAIAAVACGATVFEKHFTLDKKSEGPDHFYALEPEELKAYIAAIHDAKKALGSGKKVLLPIEKEQGRREGLYLDRDKSSGERITDADLSVRRPALGLRARYFEVVLGAAVTRDLQAGQPICWEDLSFPSAEKGENE